MAVALGKRKRRAEFTVSVKEQDSEDAAAAAHLQELLRKNFEAEDEPLDIAPLHVPESETGPEESEVEEGDDWDGISTDSERGVEVVEHADSASKRTLTPKVEYKTLMVSSLGWFFLRKPISFQE
jgi:hypothetical protein